MNHTSKTNEIKVSSIKVKKKSSFFMVAVKDLFYKKKPTKIVGKLKITIRS